MQTKKFLILVGLLKETDYNSKITEVEGKMHSISGLATTSALTPFENKMPDISNLVKKQIIMQKYYTLNLNFYYS